MFLCEQKWRLQQRSQMQHGARINNAPDTKHRQTQKRLCMIYILDAHGYGWGVLPILWWFWKIYLFSVHLHWDVARSGDGPVRGREQSVFSRCPTDGEAVRYVLMCAGEPTHTADDKRYPGGVRRRSAARSRSLFCSVSHYPLSWWNWEETGQLHSKGERL